MKKIVPPRIRDERILDKLANDTALSKTSYPHLRQQFEIIKAGYDEYFNNGGNPWEIFSPVLTEPLKVALIKHYTSPPKAVNYLDTIRNSSPEVCPMCGGFHPTTLDHILPKEDYPNWALYSLNLVPACSCNMKRGTALKGIEGSGARVLHPYFDDVLSTRNLTAKFTYALDFRWVKATLGYVNPNHEQFNSIKFHAINVVKKSGIEQWFRGETNKLKERPYRVIKTLPKKQKILLPDMRAYLTELLEDRDDEFGTPNNWNSIFIHGLLHTPELYAWIVERHNTTLI